MRSNRAFYRKHHALDVVRLVEQRRLLDIGRFFVVPIGHFEGIGLEFVGRRLLGDGRIAAMQSAVEIRH